MALPIRPFAHPARLIANPFADQRSVGGEPGADVVSGPIANGARHDNCR
jgi:hypothetical protein